MASEPEDLNTKYEETSTIDTESDINITDMNTQQSLDINEDDHNLHIIQPNQLIKHTTSRDNLLPSVNDSPSPQHNATINTTISPSKSSNIDTSTDITEPPKQKQNNINNKMNINNISLPSNPQNISTTNRSSSNKSSSNNDNIDIGTDTDSDEELNEKHINKHLPLQNIATQYDDNEFKYLPYEEELIERLGIAITYLLHDASPLWTGDNRDIDEYNDDFMNMLVAPKHDKKIEKKK
eukprot:137885_1